MTAVANRRITRFADISVTVNIILMMLKWAKAPMSTILFLSVMLVLYKPSKMPQFPQSAAIEGQAADVVTICEYLGRMFNKLEIWCQHWICCAREASDALFCQRKLATFQVDKPLKSPFYRAVTLLSSPARLCSDSWAFGCCYLALPGRIKSFLQVFYPLCYQVVKLVTAILNEVLLVHLHNNHVKVLRVYFFLILSSLLLSLSDLWLSLLFWLALDIARCCCDASHSKRIASLWGQSSCLSQSLTSAATAVMAPKRKTPFLKLWSWKRDTVGIQFNSLNHI